MQFVDASAITVLANTVLYLQKRKGKVTFANFSFDVCKRPAVA